MAELDTILDAQWDATNVAKPSIIVYPAGAKYQYTRVIEIKKLSKLEDYMGIISRNYLTADSHDAYKVCVAAATRADTEAIVDEIRRICASWTPSGDDKILEWEGGEYVFHVGWRYEIEFTVLKKKSGKIIDAT